VASAITHFVVGAALALPAIESKVIRSVLPGWAIPVSSGLLGVAPDLDTFVMRALGMPFGGFLGHRGFFHSPFFLILFCGILAGIVTRRAWFWLAVMWSASAVTHPLLDALTDGGSGVMLLFPFSDARLFLPWRPIHVSPMSMSRFFDKAGYILWSELPFCVGAIGAGVGTMCVWRKLVRNA
jgi:inner membrane protein